MRLLLAFGINVGNVGRTKLPRLSTQFLLREWNQRLRDLKNMKLEFVRSFGHTGNYLIQAPAGVHLEEILLLISRLQLSHNFVLFDYSDFFEILVPIRCALKQLPSAVPCRRWSPGIVMDMDVKGRVPPFPFSDDKVRFGAFAVSRIRTAWKGDILNIEGQKLDNRRREGGWGSLSYRMRNIAGGSWTARSMKSVEGIVKIAGSMR
ncbi:MAG: hypothetical protein KC643_32795 [Nitrospira sp.]|nr:hypothetical protein [Nitrospira sp.]